MSDVKSSAPERRRDWIPEEPIEFAPLFVWPPQPRKLAKYFLGWGGFLWPWRAIWLGLAIGSWYWLSPDLAQARNLEVGWIATIFIRNLVLMWLVAGGIHLVLYTLKLQGTELKHDPRWLFEGRRTFLFKSQVRDNIFWSCVSGVTIWTAWEVLFFYGYAHGWVPYLSWSDNPVLFVLLFPVVVVFRKIHFYFTHRMLHWPPLYRSAHYLHHKNTNPGPWSGMAMHPIEHIIYLSSVVIHFVVASHPIHMMFNIFETALAPAHGHTGFQGKTVKGRLPVGDYFHWLHHKYFEGNYGELTIPLDRWLGTFREGPEAYEVAADRRPTERHYALAGEDPQQVSG